MKAVLKEKIKYSEKDSLYVFECPEIADAAHAGQFVEVRVKADVKPFLRRPISIFDAADGKLSLLVRTVGEGTRIMEEWTGGEEVDILGPLGNGFSLEEGNEDVLLVGGGIGAAPMNLLIKTLAAAGKKIHMIFLPKRDQALMESMADLTANIDYVVCENRHGLPAAMDQMTEKADIKMVYCCGPTPLMKTVADYCNAKDIESQISLEERMGCGIGLCIGCVVAIKSGDDFEYKKVCQDGPVFSGKEVLFSE